MLPNLSEEWVTLLECDSECLTKYKGVKRAEVIMKTARMLVLPET